MGKKEAIAVVDYGTSNVRVHVFDPEEGIIVFSHSQQYPILSPKPGYLELSSADLWNSCQKCVKVVFDRLAEEGVYHIKAFSFSYFGDNLIPCDARGNPVHNIILCFDPRGAAEADEITRHFTAEWLTKKIGGRISATNVPSKLLWLKNNLGDVFDSTKQVFSNQRYTMKMLGLEPLSDSSMGGRFMMYDVENRSWCKEVLDYVGLSESMLGRTVPATTIVGEIERFGDYTLPYKIPVVIGAHDSSAGSLGTGVTSKMTGTLGNVAGTFDHYGKHDFTGKLKGSRSAGCVEGINMVVRAIPSGSVLAWFMKVIHGDMREESYQHYWQKARFDGSGAVRAAPYFYLRQGGLLGLGQDTSREEIFTALAETLIFEAKKLVSGVSADLGIRAEVLRVGGGPSKSDKLNQHKANVFGLTVHRLKIGEVSAFGAALLGAAALGMYDSLESAMEKLVKVEKEYKPDPEMQALYQKKFEDYGTFSVR